MALQVSTEQHTFITSEDTKKKGTRGFKKLFFKNLTRTETY